MACKQDIHSCCGCKGLTYQGCSLEFAWLACRLSLAFSYLGAFARTTMKHAETLAETASKSYDLRHLRCLPWKALEQHHQSCNCGVGGGSTVLPPNPTATTSNLQHALQRTGPGLFLAMRWTSDSRCWLAHKYRSHCHALAVSAARSLCRYRRLDVTSHLFIRNCPGWLHIYRSVARPQYTFRPLVK